MQSADAKLTLLSTVELAIESLAGNATPGKVSLRAADIDALVARLAQLRAGMTPEVPRELSSSAEISRVVDPGWLLHTPFDGKDKLLVVRHPGLGWMMFQLPSSEATKLGQALLSGEPQPQALERVSTSRLH